MSERVDEIRLDLTGNLGSDRPESTDAPMGYFDGLSSEPVRVPSEFVGERRAVDAVALFMVALSASQVRVSFRYSVLPLVTPRDIANAAKVFLQCQTLKLCPQPTRWEVSFRSVLGTATISWRS